MKSNFLTLNQKDFFKGMLVAVGMAVLTASYQAFSTIPVSFNFREIGLIAVGTIITYLTKNLFTNSKDKFLKTE